MRIRVLPYFAPDDGAGTATAEEDSSGDEGGGETATAQEPQGPGAADAANQEWDINELDKDSELNRAMEDVGGNLGRSEDDETEEQPEDEDAEDVTTADETGEEEQPAEDEQESDEDAGEDEPEEEGEEQPEDEEDVDEDEPEPLPDHVQDVVNEHFPNRVVETEEQLDEVVGELRETAEVFDLVDRAVEEDPALAAYMKNRFQEEMDPTEAALRAFTDLIEAPDKEEEPEKWAEWKRHRDEALEEQAAEGEAEEELSEVEQKVHDQSIESFERLQDQKDWDDQQLKAFKAQVNTLVFGDANGNLPRDQAERLYFALHKDKILDDVREEALEEGREKGRNEQIEDELGSENKGDGLPKPDGSNSPGEDLTDEEKELAAIGESFDEANTTADDFAY